MNYYKFNIGDYAAATAHLSFLEDCAYRRLIDLYYSKEQPIPADIAKACRLVRATSKDERAAVQTVLAEFFTETQDGWTHGRCDADIDAYQQKAESNRVVGKKGGRPKKQTNSDESGNPEITQMVSKNNPQETLTTNQEPLTNNHKPRVINTKPPAIAAPVGVTESVWTDFVQLRKDKKAKLTQTAIDGIQAEAAKAGWSLESALRESCARGWVSFKADWVADKQAHTQPQKQAKSFAQQDREAGLARWEELTGRTHPDRQQCAQHMGNVIEATTNILEIEQ
jgi:uncharacterized protein YdaU (DUF1376 family)